MSEQLGKETKEMEERLQQLQDKLLKQQIEDASSSGKSKWKSARVEKGGLGTNGKDLEAKHKKKMENEGLTTHTLLKGTTSNRRTARQVVQVGNFKTKGIVLFSSVYSDCEIPRCKRLDRIRCRRLVILFNEESIRYKEVCREQNQRNGSTRSYIGYSEGDGHYCVG